MKKLIKKILLSGSFLIILSSITSGSAQALDYKYKDLKVIADIAEDSSMHILEDYTAFFYLPKHGIIRKINRNYTSGGKKFHTDISNIDVKGGEFVTYQGNNGIVTIKIGDANITLEGEQEYKVSYDTYGLIKNFSGSGFAELYWNLVGSQFDTEFDKIRAEINLPKSYTGFEDSHILITTEDQKYTPKDFPGIIDWSQGDKIIIEYDEGLTAYQGLKLGIRFPKDYFTFNHERQEGLIGYIESGHAYNTYKEQRSFYGLNDANFHIILIAISIFDIIVIFIMSVTYFYKNFYKKGKIDLNQGKLRGKFAKQFPVIIQYTPPEGINSAEAGLLLHRGITLKDMLSLIYKWAAEGLIKLNITGFRAPYGESCVQITQLKEIGGDYPKYERDFFYKIIANNLFHSNIHMELEDVKKIEDYGLEKGWFRPGRLDNLLYNLLYNLLKIIFIIIIMIWPFLAVIIAGTFESGLFAFVGRCTFCILGIFMGFINNCLRLRNRLKLTESGAALVSHLVGYRQFLATCEEAQLKTFLAEDPLFFNKALPYAVAFGFETEFINKITSILNELNIDVNRCRGGISDVLTIGSVFESCYTPDSHSSSSDSSYDSSSGFDSGSSFDSDFGSDSGGGNDGGGSSW